MYSPPVRAWQTRTSDRRQAARFRCSRPPCRKCSRRTASMPALITARGCRCGEQMTSAKTNRPVAGAGDRPHRHQSVRPTPAGDLPMRRVFQDRQGNEVGELDLWKYGYDARKRSWYWQTMGADRPYVSAPSLVQHRRAGHYGQRALARQGTRRHRGRSEARHLQRFRPRAASGTAWHGRDFDQAGSLIAHPDFAALVEAAMTHPSRSQLPSVDEINSGLVATVLRRSHNLDQTKVLSMMTTDTAICSG